jgi:hypothetical protein
MCQCLSALGSPLVKEKEKRKKKSKALHQPSKIDV